MTTIAEVRQKFPQYSDLSDEQLAGALHSKFYSDMPRADFDAKIGLKAQPQQSMLSKAVEPLTSYLPTQEQFAREGLEQMSRGAGQAQEAWSGEDAMGYPLSGWERAANAAYAAGNTILGGIGYAASPINAAIRAIASKPIEDVTGIPKEYTDVVGGFMVPVPGNQMVRLRSVAAPRALTAGEEVTRAGQNLAGVGTSGAVSIPNAVASDSMAAQRVAASVANVPVAGNPLVKSAEGTTKALATKIQEIAQEYGSSSTITAGDEASKGIRDWITGKSKALVTKAYDKVDNLVNPNVRTDLSETRTAAQTILDRRANANITDKSEAVRKIEEAITNPQGLNYQGVKDLRTYVGELLDNKMLPADLRESELKQIYGALSKDLRSAVGNAGGGQALSAFERANKLNSLVADRREALAKIVGADGSTSAAQVFDRLVGMAGNTTRADMAKLAQARKAMGADAWNEVASGVVSQMGRTVDATGNVIFSPQRFLTAYQDKLSAPGRALLFRSGGKENLAPFLDDIAKISGRFRELQKFSNPSGTGQTVTGAIGLAGVMTDPMTTVGIAIGTNLLARALASPATVAPLAQWSRKYYVAVQKPSPANVAQLTIASRNLANTINAEFGSAVAGQDLLKAVQGPTKSAAEGEQPEPERVLDQ